MESSFIAPAKPARRGGLAIALAAFAVFAALACKGKTPAERLTEADKQFAQGNTLGAMIKYKDLIKKLPEGPDTQKVRFRLSQCYYQEKDYDKAREVLDQIIAKEGGTDNVTGLNAVELKITTFMDENRLPDALREAETTSPTLSKIEPVFHQRFQLLTGELYFRNNKAEDALKVFRGLLAVPPAAPRVHLDALMGIVMSHAGSNTIDAAIKECQEFVDAHPDFQFRRELYFKFGKILFSQKKTEESGKYLKLAEAEIRRELEAELGADKKSDLLFQLADVAATLDRADEAHEIYRGIIRDYPLLEAQRGRAMLILGQSLFANGKREEALQAFTQVVETYPNTRGAQMAFQMSNEIRKAMADEKRTTGTQTQAPPAEAPAADPGAAKPAEEPKPESKPEAEKKS